MSVDQIKMKMDPTKSSSGTVKIVTGSNENSARGSTQNSNIENLQEIEDLEAEDRFKSHLLLASGVAIEGVGSCESARLLLKNTESFQCLAQILLSSSSLAKQRLFLFPPLEDPGIDEVFLYVEPDPIYDATGIEKYKNTCKELNIVPLSGIVQSLSQTTMNLTYYGLSVPQIRALSETLKINTIVENLILQDNWLPIESVNMICEMLEENTTIQMINFQECRIGDEGAQRLNDVLLSSQSLKELNLSYNDLTDQGLISLQPSLSESVSLKKINLSHNHLSEDCADALNKIFFENKNIDDWDLSWNGLFTPPGNKKIFLALEKSDRIKTLNLSWNGIGTRGAVLPILKYLRKSENLEYLDLSNNRLDHRTAKRLRTSLLKNKSLGTVKLGYNLFQPEEMEIFLILMKGRSSDPLMMLDLSNMYIKKEMKPLLNQIKAIGKTVTIGGILSDYSVKGPDVRKLLFERCRYLLQKPKSKKAKKDFGHLVLALPEKPITIDEFTKEIKKRKMKKLDKDLVQGLTDQFQTKKKVDCAEMNKSYMSYYPDATLPPPKPKKKKKKKKKNKSKKGKEDIKPGGKEIELKVHDLEFAPPKDGEAAALASDVQEYVTPGAQGDGAEADEAVREAHSSITGPQTTTTDVRETIQKRRVTALSDAFSFETKKLEAEHRKYIDQADAALQKMFSTFSIHSTSDIKE